MSEPLDIAEQEPASDQDALRDHFDATNAGRLRLVSVGVGIAALFELVYALVESRFVHAAMPIAALGLARHLFVARDRALYRRWGSSVLLGGAISLLAAVVAMRLGSDLAVRLAAILAPLVLSTFRMTRVQAAVVFTLLWLAGAAPLLWDAAQGDGTWLTPRLLIQTGTVLLCIYVNQLSSRRDAVQFLEHYRLASSRNRERLRMRRELDSARQMQLSMLPREAPSFEGLDIAAVSLPAAEVGGDYYEYFTRSDQRLDLAIGDVSGHGVASALLLSGLRSCLYLLQPEQLRPEQILSRLDGMVRDTTERRTFITLLYATLDLASGRAAVAAAGHPPPLHYRMAENRVREIECASPPLGTRLGSTYTTQDTELCPGDVLVFYTDGLTETVNHLEQAYGEERLAARLERTSHLEARQIRESILADLWTFKGDAEQHDDITLVLVKVTAPDPDDLDPEGDAPLPEDPVAP